MKKMLSVLLALMLSVTALAGCGKGDEAGKAGNEGSGARDFSNTENISYVMIYNPNIYDENLRSNERLNTGDFKAYVEAVVNRAEGVEEEAPPVSSRSVRDAAKDLQLDGLDLDGGRGGSFITPYKVGDMHTFYAGESTRRPTAFICKYAGQYCNIWINDDTMSMADIEGFGQEFDRNVYQKVINMFGKTRFADNGGKVNLLFYPMSGGIGGFVCGLDLYASDEATPQDVTRYTLNTDHVIIHLNSLLKEYTDFMYPSMAHELQHYIAFGNTFDTINKNIVMRTWLNEAMSGFVEEQLYPGAKEAGGHFRAFSRSNLIRHGQSMYNFDTSDSDIGVYGSVYLFSEYLASLAGNNVFSSVHDYWRNSYSSSLDEAEAIVNSVSQDVYNNINSTLDFGDTVTFASDNEAWLSKLTFNFYLSLLKYDPQNPEAFENVKSQALLYDEINPADIEGGGRVIVALKDGEFSIPEDADQGFVYVGLNENFEVVTDYIVQ